MPAPKKKTSAKKAPAKKPPLRTGPKAGQRSNTSRSRQAMAGGAGKVDEKKAAKVRSGAGAELTAAERMLRDTRMLTRVAQGWSYAAIAAEAGLKEDQARRAVKKRREEYPLVLNLDPVRVVEEIAVGLQLSIGDLQALASAATASNNVAAAVGAVKAANDARGQVLQLLQDVGRLPTDFSQLRHLLELREIGERMVGAIRSFREAMAGLDIEEGVRAEIDEEAGRVEEVFLDLVDPSKDAPALEAA